jgi:hypothetical protein
MKFQMSIFHGCPPESPTGILKFLRINQMQLSKFKTNRFLVFRWALIRVQHQPLIRPLLPKNVILIDKNWQNRIFWAGPFWCRQIYNLFESYRKFGHKLQILILAWILYRDVIVFLFSAQNHPVVPQSNKWLKPPNNLQKQEITLKLSFAAFPGASS